jgi:hypothetical protein
VFPFSLVALSPLYTTARLALQGFGAVTGRGAAGQLAARTSIGHLVGVTLSAYVSALVALPGTLRERWRQRKRRRLGTRAFVRLLAEHRLGAREVALKD